MSQSEFLPDPRRPAAAARGPLLGAAAGLVALIVLGALALGAPAARWADARALHGFESFEGRLGVTAFAERLTHLADPAPFAILGGALVLAALLRGRLRTAAAVPLVLLGANVTTQILKPALATPRPSSWDSDAHVAAASWPSGHATASMSLVLCAVLVAAPRLRPAVAALGGVWAVAVGYSILALGWHYPSDILGGHLVAATWALAVAALLRSADARWPARSGRRAAVKLSEALAPAVLTVLGAAAVVAAAFAARPDAVIAGGARHTTFVAVALAVAALGLTVAVGVALALRRQSP